VFSQIGATVFISDSDGGYFRLFAFLADFLVLRLDLTFPAFLAFFFFFEDRLTGLGVWPLAGGGAPPVPSRSYQPFDMLPPCKMEC